MSSLFRFLIVTSMCVISVSCSRTQGKKSNDNTNTNIAKKSPSEITLKFYTWYLNDIYLKSSIDHPEVKLTKDSIYQVQPELQFEKLKATGFFANEFFKNQNKVYGACNIQLTKVKLNDVAKCGCSPSEFVKTQDCDFLSFYTWVGGQGESLNQVKIIKENTINQSSIVSTEISDDKFVFSHPKVHLINEGGTWKIAKIELVF